MVRPRAGLARPATLVHATAAALALLFAGGSFLSTAEAALPNPGAQGAAQALPLPPSAAACPGPQKADPRCPAPTDLQCADVRYYSNAACIGNWNAHCACVNQAQLAAAENGSGGRLDRRPSHATSLLPTSQGANVTHVDHYGIDSVVLTPTRAPRTSPAVKGSPIDTKINGLIAARSAGAPVSPVPRLRFGPIHAGQAAPHSPAHVPVPTMHTWTARETFARSLAANACPPGPERVACAKAYLRPGISPGLGLSSPEDFAYKRFYDAEHWTDEVNACGSDEHCRADVSLDLQTGIVGRIISGDDITPSARQAIVSGVDPQNPAKCGASGLSQVQIQLCNLFNSAPPVGVVTSSLLGPVAGGGTAGLWMTAAGPSKTVCGSTAGNCLYDVATGYWLSKNPFYDVTNLFTPMLASAFAGDPAKYRSVQGLIAEMRRGASYYYVGKPTAGPQHKSFPDEWSFQRAMNGATHDVLPGVFNDYAKRKNFLQHRVETLGQLNAGYITQGIKSVGPKGAAARRVISSASTSRPSLSGAIANPSLSAHSTQFTPTALTPTQYDTFAWGQTPPQLDPAYAYPRLLCGTPDHVRAGYSGGVGQNVNVAVGGAKGFGATEIRVAACNLANAVLDEWARKDSYQLLAPADKTAAPSGCFADDAACDWSPTTFMGGLEDLVEHQIINVEAGQREADYKMARAWWPAIKSPGKSYEALAKGAIEGGELTFVSAIRNILEVAFSHVKDVPVMSVGPAAADVPWAAASPRKGADHFATFGELRQNAEQWGNDLFGVGYDYDLGWEVPMEWQKSKANANDWDICDFGAGAHAKVEAYAFAFGSDKFDIIEADFTAGAHDGAGTDTLSPDTAKLGADLVVAGDSLVAYPPTPFAIGTPETVPLAQGSNSWTIVEIPFQISFVTLTITVGVGYTYGVNATVTPTHTNACGQASPAPSLGVTGTVTPQGSIDGIVDADVGIGPPGLADVGLEVDLVLFGIELPATASLNLVGQKTALNLQISEGLNMDFHTLDGTLSVYADLLFFRLFDIQILGWSGLHTTVPLFNTSQTLQLVDLNTIGGTGLVNPAGSLADL